MSEQIVFENIDWIVFRDRMELCDGSYIIGGFLNARRGTTQLWQWPLEVSEKSWFDINSFAPAFHALLKAAAIPVDAGLLVTFSEIGAGSFREKLDDRFFYPIDPDEFPGPSRPFYHRDD